MKIGILNDSHDRGNNSIYRLGNMHKDFMHKLDETIDLFKDCDCVIHLGDIWDRSNVSWTIIDDWIDRIESSKKMWYVLPGNHDMLGASWKNSATSALAHAIKRSEYLQILDFFELHNDVYIEGYPYFYGVEEEIRNGCLKHNKDIFTVACTHAFITIKPFHPKVQHITAKDIKTNYDIVLCSHFHHYFDKVVNGTRYLNLGAWGRLSVTEAKHKPKVAILDAKTKEIEIIELKSAKKGSEIFDLSKISEEKEVNEGLNEFIKSLESKSFQGVNLREKILFAGKELNIDKEPIELLTNKLDKLEQNNE